MNAWNRFYDDPSFHSPLSAAQCIRILGNVEHTYGDPLNPGHVESSPLDDGRILLIFKGRRFSKMMRTEYVASFADDPDGCTITLVFHKELLGMLPMTPAQDIALFMSEKLNAIQNIN